MVICNSENGSYIVGVIMTYWTVSITMVFLNKFLMTNETMSIPAPLFITWFQCVVTSFICYVAGYFSDRAQRHMLLSNGSGTGTGTGTNIGGINDMTNGAGLYSKLTNVDLDSSINGVVNGNGNSNSNNNGNGIINHNNSINATRPSFLSQFPKATYKPSIGIKIFPLSLIFVGMITFNNLCLTYVNVSFYNVARSLTIVFNMVLSYTILGIKSSTKTFLCLLVVVFGFYIGCQNESTTYLSSTLANANADDVSANANANANTSPNTTVIGTYCGIISSLFVSCNSIYTKKVLSIVDDNHWKLTFYNNINAVMILSPIVYYYEMESILAYHVEQIDNPVYWFCMILAGILGFMIGIVTVLQIKATSPLCHNFSGTGKAFVQSMCAFYIWNNEMTVEGVLSIVIVLSGSLLYTYVKMNESRHHQNQIHHHQNYHQLHTVKSNLDVESSLSMRSEER